MNAERRLVLVVDSDLGFTEEARSLLRALRVLVARSTEEAAAILPGGRVDALLLGPSLASGAGLVEAAGLHRQAPATPMLLAGAGLDNDDLLSAMRSGVDDVLTFPLRSGELAEALSRALGEEIALPDNGLDLPQGDDDPGDEGHPDPDVVVVELQAASGSEVESSFTIGPPPEAAPVVADSAFDQQPGPQAEPPGEELIELSPEPSEHPVAVEPDPAVAEPGSPDAFEQPAPADPAPDWAPTPEPSPMPSVDEAHYPEPTAASADAGRLRPR